ncbi:MAG TPA: hypothetical protein ENN03_03570 [bacterium]|nr:hypothetical protein [bacterium]
MKKSFCLQLFLIFTILNCSKQINNNEKLPVPVTLIPASSDTSRFERGIGPIPEYDGIRLEWIPADDDDVIGYRLFRSREKDGPYSLIAGQTELAQPDSFYIDGPLELDVRYYYYMTAVDYRGNSSYPSDTLNYMLIEKAIHLTPQGSTTETRPVFSWEPVVIEQAYVIRLRDFSNNIIWIYKMQSTYSNREYLAFNIDGSAADDSLTPGRQVQWRVDVISARDHCGSKSPWVTLVIQ